MRSAVLTSSSLVVSLALAACQTASTEPSVGARRPLERGPATASFEAMDRAPFDEPTTFVAARWGEGELAFARETVAAATGPMALAAERDGGVAVLDTVAGRVARFDREGGLRQSVPIGFRTGDDLALTDDGGFAVLVYERLPEPHHTLAIFASDGEARAHLGAPQVVSLPTALYADGARLLVEQRHGWLHASDGSRRAWGRPAGDLELRAALTPDRQVELEARDRRSGEARFQTTIETPWPVTDLLALDGCDRYVGVILRHIHEEGDGPAWHETWLVALDRSGAPLGRLELRDSRVTDSGRPFAFGPEGDLFELVTDDDGARILRYRWTGGGAS